MKNRWIVLAVVAAVVLTGIGWVGIVQPWKGSMSHVTLIGPNDPAVGKAELARRAAGSTGSQTRDVALNAVPAKVDLGGQQVESWTFNGQVPGPRIDAVAGDLIRAKVTNNLPDPLTVHWHGVALRNDMDGVPGVTQTAIAPGGEFSYEFVVPDPGTFFYHSHVGTQLDRGLYGPLIVTDALGTSDAAPKRDEVLIFDDWLDGTGKDPDAVLAELKSSGGTMDMGGDGSGIGQGPGGMSGGMSGDGGGMTGMDHGSGGMGGGMGGDGTSNLGPSQTPSSDPDSPLGSDIADVEYPMYLVNGKVATNPVSYEVSPGEEIRLRLINAGASVPFRVAFAGGPMTVVATDGFPVEPVAAESIIVGMGERYDVVVRIPETGAFPMVGAVEGGGGQAMGVFRTKGADMPSASVRPAGLSRTPLALDQLHATSAVALPNASPDRGYKVALTGGMMAYDWGIVVAPKEGGSTLPVRQGERIRLTISNDTMMWHPIHLHGHAFQVVTGQGAGPRKDTVAIPPMQTVTVDFKADNPGQWMLHCHNIYHAEAGMMTTLSYVLT